MSRTTKAKEIAFVLPWLRTYAEQGSIVDRACAVSLMIALGEGVQVSPAAAKFGNEVCRAINGDAAMTAVSKSPTKKRQAGAPACAARLVSDYANDTAPR